MNMGRNIETITKLSPMQQGMLFHSLVAPRSGIYCEQLICSLDGPLQVEAFHQAWERVLQRHQILRTAFSWEQIDQPVAIVYRSVDLPFDLHDWRHLAPQAQEQRLRDRLAAGRQRGFALDKAPLMHLALVQTANESYRFVWQHHHLLLDGWSLPIIMGEVLHYYQMFCTGAGEELPPPPPFSRYLAWLDQQQRDEAQPAWRDALAQIRRPTPLVVDRTIAKPAESYATVEKQLGADTTAVLTSLCEQSGITLSTLVHGAWALLLSRYSGDREVLFGSTVSGRPPDLPDIDQMVGLLINTLPALIAVPGQAPVFEWLQDLQLNLAALAPYAHLSLPELHSWSGIPRDQPFFESIVVFENYPVAESLLDNRGPLQISAVQAFEQTNYPLTLVSAPAAALPLKIAYDGHRFDRETIERMLGHLRTLLEGIATDPSARIDDLPLLTAAEQQTLLVAWNDTAVPFPDQQAVHVLIEQQADQNPDHLAVLDEDGTALTYAELDQQANQLAHYLIAQGVEPDQLVGVMLGRSPAAIVAILGILKAGGAYLPIDPAYPAERIQFTLEDAQVRLVVTTSALAISTQLPDQIATIPIDDPDVQLAGQPRSRPATAVTADNLAYAIYTSGSTGRPKGVLIAHRGLCNLAVCFAKMTSLQTGCRMLQFFSLAFDGSVVELFGSLSSGATLVTTRKDTVMYGPDLLALLNRMQISHASLTPSLLRSMSQETLPHLAVLISATEQCPRTLAEQWGPGRTFLNGYGPTETTVAATWHIYNPADTAWSDVVPIGKPLPNCVAYVVDQALRPVPIGVPGELLIGGVGVARGYLNRPAQTNARFIANPFDKSNSGRLYRSGDLVRYLPDGSLEFIGRIDRQVKIRGYRVEPGEIELQISGHPSVAQACVIAHDEDGREPRLVAYIIPAGEEEPVLEDLQDHLAATMPAHMFPATFLILDELPRLPNGKIDLQALPQPDSAYLAQARSYVAPQTPAEELVAGVWAKILGLPRVGIHDDFYQLGGHSLLGTQVVSRLRRLFKVDLPLRALFENRTVAELALAIAGMARDDRQTLLEEITPTPRSENIPLSFAQQRLWFLEQLEPGNRFYNIPAAIRCTGPLDVSALQQALAGVIQRHEVLRTRFVSRKGQPSQVILDDVAPNLPLIDLWTVPAKAREAAAEQALKAEVLRPFDLAEDALLRMSLLKLTDEDHILVLVLHHIIADGWSLAILVRELAALYQAALENRPAALPALPIQYADFAQWQRGWLAKDVLQSQLDYWQDQLAGVPALLDLPADHPRPTVKSWRGRTESFRLSRELSEDLQQLCRTEGVTLFMALLAAYQVLLSRYSGREDICVGTAVANRNRTEVEPLIGFFVNTLVMRGDLSGQPTYQALLRRTREVALQAYAHQDLPFEMLVEAIQPQRNMSHTPLFQVAFSLQNTSLSGLDLPNLSWSPLPVDNETAKFDLTLEMAADESGLRGYLEYNTDLFEQTTIRRMISHFEQLLQGMVTTPDRPVTQLPLLTDLEAQTILHEWNDTAVAFPDNVCIHDLFAAQAGSQPHAIAVVYREESVSYGTLNHRANQLAHYLIDYGIGSGDLVGISIPRSVEMIVAILGVLKAGAAYIPLDPTYPAERLAFMVSDARPAAVLVTSQPVFMDHLTGSAPLLIDLLEEDAVLASQSDMNPDSRAAAGDLAYVIYTSGSTGAPKGTMLAHRGLCNLTDVQRRAFAIRPGHSRVLQFSPLSFDASVWEIFMALRNGATLVLADQEVLSDGRALVALLREAEVTTVTLPPSLLAVLPEETLPHMATVIAAGEACSRELVARWAPGRAFFNAYGPTETTVCASMYRCDAAEEEAPPIGRPIDNFQLYVVDQHLQPLPVGIPGELCVGGIGLARGYLNRPELTAERFVRLPALGGLQTKDGRPFHLYRTGDLVRLRPDGNFEYLGRIDSQVKVRGVRVELGEVEEALRRHEQVVDAAVVASGPTPADRRLVAYVVLAVGEEAMASELRPYLRGILPDAMVPSVYVEVEAFPLTPSGKVDRRALAAQAVLPRATKQRFVAPRTETEATLVALAASLLQVERIGVFDDFFELGGHSLLATQLMSDVQEEFDVAIPLRALFEEPTVAALAAQVDAQASAGNGDMRRIEALLEQVESWSDADVARVLAEGQSD